MDFFTFDLPYSEAAKRNDEVFEPVDALFCVTIDPLFVTNQLTDVTKSMERISTITESLWATKSK